MKYIIKWHNGLTDEIGVDTLCDAETEADSMASYTQQDISITDADGNELSRRTWWGVEYNEDENPEENPICFGSFGYYSDWQRI